MRLSDILIPLIRFRQRAPAVEDMAPALLSQTSYDWPLRLRSFLPFGGVVEMVWHRTGVPSVWASAGTAAQAHPHASAG